MSAEESHTEENGGVASISVQSICNVVCDFRNYAVNVDCAGSRLRLRTIIGIGSTTN